MPNLLQPCADGPARKPDYVRRKVVAAVEFDARGRHCAIQPIDHSGLYGFKTMAVPRPLRLPGHRSSPNFLCDLSRIALGLKPVGERLSHDPDLAAFAAFRDLHLTILRGANDTVVAAFLRFIEGWDPLKARSLADLNPLRDGLLVFRFQYDSGFVHERHAVRVLWRKHLAMGAPQGAPQAPTMVGTEAEAPTNWPFTWSPEARRLSS
jgi:CRISPR-associated protein Csd1